MAGYGYSSYRISMTSQIGGGPVPKPFAPFVPSHFNGNVPPSEGHVTKKKIVPVASGPYADNSSDDDDDGDEWKHQRQTSPVRGRPSNSYGDYRGNKPVVGGTSNKSYDGYDNGTNYGNKQGTKPFGGAIKNDNHDGTNYGYGDNYCGNKEGCNLIDSPVKKDNYGGYGSLPKKDNYGGYGSLPKKDNYGGYGNPIKKDNHDEYGSPTKKDNYGGYGSPIKKDNHGPYGSPVKKDNYGGYGNPINKDNHDAYGSPGYGNPIKKDNHVAYGSPTKKDNYEGYEGYKNPVKKDNFDGYGSPAKKDNYDGSGDYNNKEGPKTKPKLKSTDSPVYNNGYGGRGWTASPKQGTTPLTKPTNDIEEAIELLKKEAANRGYKYDDNNPHQHGKGGHGSLSSRPVQPHDKKSMDLVNETEGLTNIVTGAPPIQPRTSGPVIKDDTRLNGNLNRPRSNFADGRPSDYGVINHKEAEKRFNGMTI